MSRNIILSADSICDLGPELKSKYDVKYFNYHIQIGEESFIDMEEITPDDIYAAWRKRKVFPKTAAVTPQEYRDYFTKWTYEGCEVIHINLGSSLTSAHHNCMLAASDLEGVYAVDSANLSSGTGMLVLRAGDMIASGCGAKEIHDELIAYREKIRCSFLLDTLEFMRAGGRCNAVAAVSATLLSLKPCIEVDQRSCGTMGVGKKYMGSMEKCLAKYAADKLSPGGIDMKHAFVTNSGAPESQLELIRAEMARHAAFENVYTTRANGTICCHCGPGTIGIIFAVK